MADETFDTSKARSEHETIITKVRKIKDLLLKDIIDYYYNAPESESDERTKREGIRKYLRIAREDIDRLLNQELY